jgi:UDP-2,3-diacylglucosamine pyrophosphatase LpxH
LKELKKEINRKGYTCVRANVGSDDVYLVGLGDLHAGSHTYNEAKTLEIVKFIYEENCVWVGMGDFCENATKRSVGSGVYQQTMTPDEQEKYIIRLLEPIADKCIGYVKGNHEERAYKDSAHDMADSICFKLGMPYCIWEFFGIISGLKRAYTVYAVHSSSGSKTGGSALNAAERDIEKMLNVDIIMVGHNHKRAYHDAESFDIDSRNNCVTVRQKAIVMTGHYMERDKSYAAAKPMRGDPMGTIALRLIMDQHKEKKIYPVYL